MSNDVVQVGKKIIKIIDNIPIFSNTVIVYDIDGTLLDTNGNPIGPIIDSYIYAKSKGMIPVIITARPAFEKNIMHTREQLSNVGVTEYKYMYFMPLDKEDQALYKLNARKNLFERGYRVAMSIGDMPWDYGEYGGIGVKV